MLLRLLLLLNDMKQVPKQLIKDLGLQCNALHTSWLNLRVHQVLMVGEFSI